MKKYDVVEIEWIDSIHNSGWKPLSEISFGDGDRIRHKTVGYFIEKNKHTTVVVQSMQEKIYSDKDRIVDAIMEIPNCAINKIRSLKR